MRWEEEMERTFHKTNLNKTTGYIEIVTIQFTNNCSTQAGRIKALIVDRDKEHWQHILTFKILD